MKKLIITITIVLSSFSALTACEICGCGTGNYYLGLLPQFSKHFIGMRYQFNSFKTIMNEHPSEFSKDLFQTVELWGGINIGKRWQLLAVVPFNIIHQLSDDGATNNNGIGDIALIGNYKVLDRSSATRSKKLVSHQLWLGSGIKLATGKFMIDPSDEAFVALANTQVGSASTDFLINAMYNISVNKFGVNTGARYKINTANNDHYYFGNKFSATSFAYLSFGKKIIITPNAGFLFENNEASKLGNEKIEQSGGYLCSTAAGVEIGINKITIGCNTQLPLAQNFANNQTHSKVRGMLHVTFAL